MNNPRDLGTFADIGSDNVKKINHPAALETQSPGDV